MSLPDATASSALSADIIKPAYFAFLDFATDPVLANTTGADVTPSGTGITKLDGNTFLGVDGHFVELSPISQGSAGSKSITATLSGIPGDAVDDDSLAVLDDPTQWQGRDADVWQIIRDADNTEQGAYRLWCSGKIVALNHGADDRGMKITVHIEGYLAALSEASHRTYLDQERIDPDDLSAAAALAIANGSYNKQLVGSSYAPGTYVPGIGTIPGGGLF